MESVCLRMKELRKKLNMTQVDFAKVLGVTNAHISKIEKGGTVPSNALIKLMCKEYDVNEHWLKDGIDPMFMALDTEYYSDEVAIRINECLKKNGLSQKDMLEKCNLSKNTISSMLSRGSMPRADNLAKIADYLECSIDYLIGRATFSSHKQAETYDNDLELLKKLHSLPEDSQDEITHMVNYKYDQLQKKRSQSLSHSEPEMPGTSDIS